MTHDKILILDFGSQVTQLIARRVRENRVYCEVHPFDLPIDQIRERRPIGVVLSGGPQSVYDDGAPLPLMVTHDPRAAERAHVVLHLDKGVLMQAVLSPRVGSDREGGR